MVAIVQARPKANVPLATLGAILILLGILGLAHPRWKTSSTRRVAHIGPAETINETFSYRVVPAYLSITFIAGGAGLLFLGSRKS